MSEPAPDVRRPLWVLGAVAIAGGPLAYVTGGVLSPSIHATGAQSIAAAATAVPLVNGAHVVAFVLASYLLPVGAAALARLAWPAAPRLALAGGLLAVVGWLPFSALTALDDLINAMARTPGGDSYAGLLDRFGTDPVMSAYLLVYIAGHLVGYVVLAVALRRAGVVPPWAEWAMIASSPLTIVAFALPGSPRVLGGIALALLALGSLPAARRALGEARRRHPEAVRATA